MSICKKYYKVFFIYIKKSKHFSIFYIDVQHLIDCMLSFFYFSDEYNNKGEIVE